MKRLIRSIFKATGYDVRKYHKASLPATDGRPVGQIVSFLEDIKARGFEPGLVFDIGANNGDWSRRAKNVFPKADFILVEPQYEMESQLKDFCSAYPGSGYYLAGAGPAEEQKFLTIWEDLKGSSFLPSEKKELIDAGKQRIVDIITIDSIVQKNGSRMPDLIKLDIQGFELEALRGAENTFGKTEFFILEVSLFPFSDTPGTPVFHEVISFMLKRGYVVYDFPGFMRRPYDGALAQCDVCFVRADGRFRKMNNWN
jgi:FkbM family methyltransferase